MRYLVAAITGVGAYALTLFAMSDLLRVQGSSWYWLPFLASLAAVVAAVRPWRTIANGRRSHALAAIVGCAVLVLVIDLLGAIWLSCVKGICM